MLRPRSTRHRSRPRLQAATRGQAFTLEGLMAALLLAAALFFVVQTTVLTPLSASTASQHIETAHHVRADDMLTAAASNGSLHHAVLYRNTTDHTFVGTSDEGYTQPPATPLGQQLDALFAAHQLAVNVDLYYQQPNRSQLGHATFLSQGTPSSNAVTVSQHILLTDQLQLTTPGDDRAIGDLTNFYIPDAAPHSHVYNTVEIRVTVWQL